MANSLTLPEHISIERRSYNELCVALRDNEMTSYYIKFISVLIVTRFASKAKYSNEPYVFVRNMG